MSYHSKTAENFSKIPKIHLGRESPINEVEVFINKTNKIVNNLYPFMDPLPKDMTDCRPWQFKDTPIDWRMLTSSRPQTKIDEELFTRIIEMSRLQYTTKITDDEENKSKLAFLSKRNGRLYSRDSESSENELDNNNSFEDFARNEYVCSTTGNCYGEKVINSKQLVEKLSELMSGKHGPPKTKAITKNKKKQPKCTKSENASSSKDNSCSEETDLGSSESVATPPITTPKPKKKIFTRRARNKTKIRVSKSPRVELEDKSSPTKLERSLPKLERPTTAKEEKRNKVIYIKLPQI